MLGMSQRKLAEALGIEPPTLSKYEQNRHSVSAALLYEIARVLDASPEYFFGDIEKGGSAALHGGQRLQLSFMHSISKIDNKAHLEALSYVARALADGE